MKPIKTLVLNAQARIAKWALTLYLSTIRRRLHVHSTVDASIQGAVYAIWHDSIIGIPILHPVFLKQKGTVHLMISNSRDGRFPSALAKQYRNINVIRVRHDARSSALKQAIQILASNNSILITPDGPKGPRHKIKPGVLAASQIAQKPIIPIHVRYSKAIQLRSWDRFCIPLPFSSVDISVGPALFPGENFNTTADIVEAYLNGLA